MPTRQHLSRQAHTRPCRRAWSEQSCTDKRGDSRNPPFLPEASPTAPLLPRSHACFSRTLLGWCFPVQVMFTLMGVAGIAMALTGMNLPSAIILGGALAMSSTAVAIQVLEDRSEMGSKHGKAVFSVLLLQVGVLRLHDSVGEGGGGKR